MSNQEAVAALNLINFWQNAGPSRWFQASDTFDGACREHVGLWEEARAGAHRDWWATAAGTLAYILVTDQIPRNVFRGQAQQFETDGLALEAARHAVAHSHPLSQGMPMQKFYLLPFQHAEDLSVQEESVDLHRMSGDADAHYWALVHFDAIRRFGRFPHRNALLGRETTPDEAAYLASGGFGG